MEGVLKADTFDRHRVKIVADRFSLRDPLITGEISLNRLKAAGVDMLTTAFLNVVIGDLYKDYSSEKLKSMLILVNYTEPTAKRIKKVTDNAKLFYKDESAYTKEVEEVLNGTN